MSTFLETELREQPAALARLLERQADTAREVGELFRRDDVDYVLIASRGSSSNAARYGQYLLGRAHRVPVAFATPSLYTLYEQPPKLKGALVIGISQSGESPDVRSVVEEAKRQGRPTIALTNTPGSPLARAADAVLPLEAGEERSVAATKTYLNSLGALALLFAASTRDNHALAELEGMPGQVAGQLERSAADIDALDSIETIAGGTVVARGIAFGTAYEIALKVRELSGLLFEAYSSADLMHGPVAAVTPDWPVVAVAPSGPARASMQDAIDALTARGARLYVIGDDPNAALPLLPGVPEWLSPLIAVVPGQLLAKRIAELRGVDIDRPGGLSKITLTH
ncbi:MAG TPA: SIS domain-containing protein [Gaiellaceae bacterium]|nr:SIS domain-containing protein [Gaiellaceae bacterium]